MRVIQMEMRERTEKGKSLSPTRTKRREKEEAGNSYYSPSADEK